MALSDPGFVVVTALGWLIAALIQIWRPFESPLRQALALVWMFAGAAGAGVVAAELLGWTDAMTAAVERAVLLATFAWMAFGGMVFTADYYFNFDTLSKDKGYRWMGRTPMAFGLILGAAVSLALVTIIWHEFDSEIFELRGNYLYWVASDPAAMTFSDYMLFALDQTAKALLFDVTEVYRVGLTNLGNNPFHLGFSTLCLLYRLAVSVFLLSIVYRLIVHRDGA